MSKRDFGQFAFRILNAKALQCSASSVNCFEHVQNHSFHHGSFPDYFWELTNLSIPTLHCVW